MDNGRGQGNGLSSKATTAGGPNSKNTNCSLASTPPAAYGLNQLNLTPPANGGTNTASDQSGSGAYYKKII